MNEVKIIMTEAQRANLAMIEEHRRTYLESGGREGHVFDSSSHGGHYFLTTLLIETFGRKSGKRRITALNYGDIGGEVAIIASKGGADIHPAWYLNLIARETVVFQIATQAFRATWREVGDDDYDRIWDFMASNYPPFAAYRAGTKRRIPISMLKPIEAVDVLKAE